MLLRTDTQADAAYLALKARDARFDGRFFVGVTSTGVYCPARVPRAHAQARELPLFPHAGAGRGRGLPALHEVPPEIAPGLSHTDSSPALADSAAALISAAVHAGQPLPMPALAARLGVTDRHLRRIFQATHGVSPLDHLATQRLLLAKQLLTDTTLPITQVALASGYTSLRRFNAAFVERYRFQPTQLRRAATPAPADDTGPTLRLAYRPPLDADLLFGHYARRVMPGVEAVELVEGLQLRRTLAWAHAGQTLQGWIALRLLPERHEVHLQAAPALTPALGALLQRVRQALDLDADPERIDPVLTRLPVPHRPGARLPGAFLRLRSGGAGWCWASRSP